MKMCSLLLALALSGGVRVLAETPADTPSADVMTMVQDSRCKQVTVTCLVNNQPLRMLLDTGASHTVLHTESAAALRGAQWIDTSQMNFRGNAHQRPGMLVASLQTGPGKLPEHSFMVLDLSAVRGSMAEKVDGILGMDVLGHLPFTFDQRKGAFYWGIPKNEQTYPLPGKQDKFGRLIVRAECAGKILELLLDTGSSVTRLHADMWPVGAGKETAVQVSDVNDSAKIQVQIGKAADLVLSADVVLPAVSPVFSSAEQPPVLGMDALKHVALVHVPSNNSPFGFFYIVK